jgi:hypothetical protein
VINWLYKPNTVLKFMTRHLFTWILIILLLISGTLLGLELYGQDRFKPSLRFGVNKNPDVLALIEGQKSLKDQIAALDKKIDNITAGNPNPTTNSSTNNALPVSGAEAQSNLPTSNPNSATTQNPTSTTTLPADPNSNPNQPAQQPSATQNTGPNSLFTNCVTQNGRDEAGFTATLKSNICILSGVNIRPDTFTLNAEILEYQEGVSSGGKVKNSQGEVFNFTGSDTLLFTPETSKVGDKFKVSATVKNLNGIYTFQTFSKVEKVV